MSSLAWDPIRFNPSFFHSYQSLESILKNKVFLYTERHPTDDVVEYETIQFKLGAFMQVHLPSHITNPRRALYKIIEVSYEKDALIKFIQECDGVLFIYDGFTFTENANESLSSETAVELNFIIYQLIEIWSQ